MVINGYGDGGKGDVMAWCNLVISDLESFGFGDPTSISRKECEWNED